MTERDVMVGDYVTFKDCQKRKPAIIEIVEIAHRCLARIDKDDVCDIVELDEDIVGIPITEETLKNNGFGYVEGDGELSHYYLGEPCFCKDMNLHIGNKKNVFWVDCNGNHVGGLRYVHELQHVFRVMKIQHAEIRL